MLKEISFSIIIMMGFITDKYVHLWGRTPFAKNGGGGFTIFRKYEVEIGVKIIIIIIIIIFLLLLLSKSGIL